MPSTTIRITQTQANTLKILKPSASSAITSKLKQILEKTPGPKKEKKTVVTSLWLPDELIPELNEYAKANGLSVTSVLSKAVDEVIVDHM